MNLFFLKLHFIVSNDIFVLKQYWRDQVISYNLRWIFSGILFVKNWHMHTLTRSDSGGREFFGPGQGRAKGSVRVGSGRASPPPPVVGKAFKNVCKNQWKITISRPIFDSFNEDFYNSFKEFLELLAKIWPTIKKFAFVGSSRGLAILLKT